MPRTPSTTQPVVILHGWLGSGPEHWQTWLAGRLAAGHEVRYPQLPDADHPRLVPWLTALDETLSGLPDGGYDLVCHSLAVPLWLHRAAAGLAGPAPARVLLVAPPSPRSPVRELTEFLPPPLDAEAVRRAAGGTILVCADDDPFCPEGARAAYGLPLKLPTTVVPGGGHLNSDTGYGPWPAVERWCSRPNLAFPL
ncbi:MAG TPA: alpha/beta hydrolase [Mycobacteriales bacterium]|nr:alpha/beta hydrolase [Mycobacteriales bacterium]